jgi:hypothetical protein
MKTTRTALIVVAAAMTSAAVAGAGPSSRQQRVAITAKEGIEHFALTPLKPGLLGPDSGTAKWCCWQQRFLIRGGQSVEINDPLGTFSGKRGKLVLRFRIEWLDAGNGYTVGASSWKVVGGTGAYAHVTGAGRGAASWLPRGLVSFRAEGFVHSR